MQVFKTQAHLIFHHLHIFTKNTGFDPLLGSGSSVRDARLREEQANEKSQWGSMIGVMESTERLLLIFCSEAKPLGLIMYSISLLAAVSLLLSARCQIRTNHFSWFSASGWFGLTQGRCTCRTQSGCGLALSS